MSIVPTKILIIDDLEECAEFFSCLLNQKGYKTLTAYSGREGIEKAQIEVPDLILLDLNMKGLNGLDVYRILRSDPKTKNIPIVFMTAVETPGDLLKQAVLGMGADGFLHKEPIKKPASADKIYATIGKALEIKKKLPQETIRKRGNVIANFAEGTVTITTYKNKVVKRISGKPLEIFAFLFESSGPCSTQDILSQVWGTGEDIGIVRKNIERLRIALHPYGERIIRTISHGYLFNELIGDPASAESAESAVTE